MRHTMIAAFSSPEPAAEALHKLKTCGAAEDDVGVVASGNAPAEMRALLVVRLDANGLSRTCVEEQVHAHQGREVDARTAAQWMMQWVPGAADPYNAPEEVLPALVLSVLIDEVEQPTERVEQPAQIEEARSPKPL